MKLSVSILCVPKRYQMAKTLLEQVLPYIPDARIFCDIQYKGSWFGTRNCWKQVGKTATHHLVLEEDILLCRDFFPAVDKIIHLNPLAVITFYALKSEKHKLAWADRENSSWYVHDAGAPGPAVLMPKEYIYDFLAFTDKWVKPETKYEDSRLWGWQKIRGYHTWGTNPCLVEHLGGEISALGFNNPNKTAAKFIGEQSALDIDWSKGLDRTLKIFEYTISENFIKGFKGKITYV